MTDKQKEAAVTAAYLRGFETGQDAAKSRIAALEAALSAAADSLERAANFTNFIEYGDAMRAARAAMENNK